MADTRCVPVWRLLHALTLIAVKTGCRYAGGAVPEATRNPGSDAQRPLVVDNHRRMLGEAHLARDAGMANEAPQPRGENLIVEAQPQVQVLGLLAVGPPAVQIGFAGDFAQCIDIAEVAEDLVHPGPFRRHEAGLVLAVAPVLHVQLQMGGMQGAAVDELPALAPLLL